MINPTELDVRFLNHAAHIDYANQFGTLYPALRPAHSGPRRFVATLLLRLSVRLAPEQAQQTIVRKSASA